MSYKNKDEKEIEDLEKDFENAELEESNLKDSVKTFDNSVDIGDIYSQDDLAEIAKSLEEDTVGVHRWVKNTPVIIKVISDCEFTVSKKIEQFNAVVSMRVNGILVNKHAKINVVSGMRNQLQKHMKCFKKGTKTVNRDDITYQKKINGHIFKMLYTGESDSRRFKDPKTGLPVKTKSIVVRMIG